LFENDVGPSMKMKQGDCCDSWKTNNGQAKSKSFFNKTA